MQDDVDFVNPGSVAWDYKPKIRDLEFTNIQKWNTDTFEKMVSAIKLDNRVNNVYTRNNGGTTELQLTAHGTGSSICSKGES